MNRFIYVFDAALMFFAMVAMNVVHPCKVLSSSHKGGRHTSEVEVEETQRDSV